MGYDKGGGERGQGASAYEEEGPMELGIKRKNFCKEGEEQLCRSVLIVIQDHIVGNQKKTGVFWERIDAHYNEYRPRVYKSSKSFESK